MRRWIDLVLCTILCALALGCRPQPASPKLIYNIPGPEVPLYHAEWELYEHHFLTRISPKEAISRLQSMGYRFITSKEEPMAKAYVLENCRLIALSLGLIYLDHPIIVLIRSDESPFIHIMGFDPGLAPRPIREFYEHAKLGEEYGWLVMREKPLNR